jgi:hypothetical protein
LLSSALSDSPHLAYRVSIREWTSSWRKTRGC